MKSITAGLAALAAVAMWAAVMQSGPAAAGEPLLKTRTTILGQALDYPAGDPAEVTSLIVTLEPGEETGWHKHPVPLHAYLLSGQITVDYGEDGTRTYRPGEALMEAVGSWHNGHNAGPEPARILVVVMGAVGREITVER
jgi:quercetin dioxygenase-like cupin family protein